MNKIYYLSTCDTCKRIISELDLPTNVELQDIKANPVSEKELEELKTLAGSYEALFSKRARLYKERDLKNKDLSEEDYKNLILEHYTFLKRPVLVHGDDIFIGNAKKTVEAAKTSLHE
ncbi:arsenate reductase family protein [Salinimicrobium sp. GXAS 041]|uniref:arsenate reductase family protein n=1 Tax=Salinimicrobium sp. GXAS 041 TaxID=3400806 RepID=UPI003C78845F